MTLGFVIGESKPTIVTAQTSRSLPIGEYVIINSNDGKIVFSLFQEGGYKLALLDNPIIIDSNIDKVSSFMINYGLYNYALPDREYIESVQDTLITKKFRIHKVYEKEILGQSNSASVHLEIEEAIIKHTSDFIEQWFRDNPFRQF